MDPNELKAAIKYGLKWYCIFWTILVLVLGVVVHLAIILK